MSNGALLDDGFSSTTTGAEFIPDLPLDLIEFHQNARTDLGDLAEMVATVETDGVRQAVTVFKAGEKYKLWLGHRRVEASRLAGKTTIPAMVCPEPSPDQFIATQLVENLHHASMDDRDIYRACKELEKLGLNRREIGGKLGKSAPSVTKFFSPDNVSQETREHFFAGRLSYGQCYAISLAEDPEAASAAYLSGCTRETAARVAKPKKDAPREMAPRVKIPLAANSSEFHSGGFVTVSSLPGTRAGIDWEGTENLLKSALRLVREAQAKKWSIKSAANAWRDAAANSNA